MNIINSGIVPAGNDVFWKDVSDVLQGQSPAPVLILTDHFEDGSADDIQLQKMIGACQLKPGEYTILKIKSDQQIAWHQLNDKLNPDIIFLIGVLPAQLGISSLFSLNVPNNFNDKIWLPSLSLKELAQNQEMKTGLWVNGMKPLFVDKSFTKS